MLMLCVLPCLPFIQVFQQIGGIMFVDLLGVDVRAAELGYPQCSTARDVLVAAGHAVQSRTLPQAVVAAEPAGIQLTSP